MADDPPRYMGAGFVVLSSNNIELYHYMDEPGLVPEEPEMLQLANGDIVESAPPIWGIDIKVFFKFFFFFFIKLVKVVPLSKSGNIKSRVEFFLCGEKALLALNRVFMKHTRMVIQSPWMLVTGFTFPHLYYCKFLFALELFSVFIAIAL